MKKIILYLSLLFVQFSVLGQSSDGFPEKPSTEKLVNNFSKEFPDFLSASEESALEEKLEKFSNETSNQILIIIVDDLNGYEPSEYAIEVGEKWGVGQEKTDNGVVILIKPTGGKGERKTFIAVGRGLEGAIPDLTANQIVENEMIPYFKEGDFATGIDRACDVIMKLAKGEYNSKDYGKSKKGYSGIIFVIIIVVIIVLLVKFGPKNNNRGGGGRGWTYGRGGYWGGGFGGGSSGGFSGGGGGFGGFGGGSFGGGGSGGSW